jgi:hypothetical protein
MIPPAAAAVTLARAVSAAANSNEAHPAHVSGSAGQATLLMPFTDQHSEQEEYLWGV